MERDYEQYAYYALKTTHEHAKSLQEDYGYRYERVGELPNYFLFEISKLCKRSTEFQALDIEMKLQVPQKRLFKRNIEDIKTRLSINDPGFSLQWHLV